MLENAQVIRIFGESIQGSPRPQASPKADGSLSDKNYAEQRFLSFIDQDNQRQTLSLVQKPVVTIGRSASSDIRINQSNISNVQAQCRVDENGEAWIDSKSTEGAACKVNGSDVSRSVQLKQGDRIDVGGRVIIYGELASVPLSRKNSTSKQATTPEKRTQSTPERTPEEDAALRARIAQLETENENLKSQLSCMSPMTRACADVQSESSPMGSALLARKMRAQAEAKRTLSLQPLVLPSDKDGVIAPHEEVDMHRQSLWNLTKHLGPDVNQERQNCRMSYNKTVYSPSMGFPEEQQQRLRQQYEASKDEASSSNTPTPERHFLSTSFTDATSLRTPDDGSAESSSELGLPHHSGSIALFRDTHVQRIAYNRTVYSPSMMMGEAEIVAIRATLPPPRPVRAGGYPHSSAENVTPEEEDFTPQFVRSQGVIPYPAKPMSSIPADMRQ